MLTYNELCIIAIYNYYACFFFSKIKNLVYYACCFLNFLLQTNACTHTTALVITQESASTLTLLPIVVSVGPDGHKIQPLLVEVQHAWVSYVI